MICITDKNCDQMLRAEAATTVCSRLMDPDPTGQLLFRSVDILWNMLENGDQGQLAEQLNNLTCIRYCVRPKKKKMYKFRLTRSWSNAITLILI